MSTNWSDIRWWDHQQSPQKPVRTVTAIYRNVVQSIQYRGRRQESAATGGLPAGYAGKGDHLMPKEWTEAEIAAWVDGSLDSDSARRVESIVANDPGARACADAIQETNRALRAAFAAPIDEPVPASIEAAIMGAPGAAGATAAPAPSAIGTVTPFRPRRAEAPPLPSWRPMALAASLALVVGMGAGALWWGGEGGTVATGGTIAALGGAPIGGPLHQALETEASGTLTTDGVRPMLTFYDDSQRVCREFEVVGELPSALELGIACRSPSGSWDVEIVVTAGSVEAPQDGGFATASGPGGDALEAALDGMGAGVPLAPGDEARLIEDGWQRIE